MAVMMAAGLAGTYEYHNNVMQVQAAEQKDKDTQELKETAENVLADHATDSEDTGFSKEESVYVKADASGNVKKTTVSEWLKNPEKGTISDTSELKDIKNVIFDLGGVLVDLDIERCTAAFRELGMNRVAGLINPCYPAEMIGRLERGDLSFHEACDAMRKLDGRYDVTDAQIAGAYGAFLAGVPVWKLRQVERLRGAGIRTYVLSNNNPASMEVIRGEFTADGHTMDDYFDKVYLSYELRELKPSEAIFRKVIADSGIVPAQTLFIDDGQKNVDAAQALGFAVYKPAPGEDFGHLLEEITATK